MVTCCQLIPGFPIPTSLKRTGASFDADFHPSIYHCRFSTLYPMRLSRNARGHFLQHSHTFTNSISVSDHVWISQELLTSTFRSFARGQRRHGSQVPGPLEARRRLAKRRNTALASVTGSGPFDDPSCLFGENGKEHKRFGLEGPSLPGENNQLMRYLKECLAH